MKKYLIILLILVACQKEKQPEKGMITAFHITSSEWNLVINNIDYGTIMNDNRVPKCGEAMFDPIELEQGTYEMYAKNTQGYDNGDVRLIKIFKDSCILVQFP